MNIHTIASFEEFHNLIGRFNSSAFAFRGQGNASWSLTPKIGRPEYHNKLSPQFTEHMMLQSWQRYAVHYIQKEPIDVWDWLIMAQHYGLATRLLDWSKNPLTALYFAVIDNTNFTDDAALFVLDFKNIVLQTENNQPFNITKPHFFFPKGISTRILSQRSVFTISNAPQEDLATATNSGFDFHKIIIKKTAIKPILNILTFYGINEFAIFQDLDNLSKHLNRNVRGY